MTFAVLVEPYDGRFAATLAGVPDLRAIGSTRVEAIDELKSQIQQRIEAGELLPVEFGSSGVTALAGTFRDDPTLREIAEEAYRRRDAELAE